MVFIQRTTLVFLKSITISVIRTGRRRQQRSQRTVSALLMTHPHKLVRRTISSFQQTKESIRSSCSLANGSCMLMSSSESANAAEFMAGRHGFLSPVSFKRGRNHRGGEMAEPKMDFTLFQRILRTGLQERFLQIDGKDYPTAFVASQQKYMFSYATTTMLNCRTYIKYKYKCCS